jgi:hypothetical protein
MIAHASRNHLRTNAGSRWITDKGCMPKSWSGKVRRTCTSDGGATFAQPAHEPPRPSLALHPLPHTVTTARATAATASFLATCTDI